MGEVHVITERLMTIKFAHQIYNLFWVEFFTTGQIQHYMLKLIDKTIWQKEMKPIFDPSLLNSADVINGWSLV